MDEYVALLRGINVGRAKRIAMADLRACVEAAGGSAVRTILSSGNVCFSGPRRSPRDWSSRIRSEIQKRAGFDCSVLVLEGTRFRDITRDNPIIEAMSDGSRFLVAYFESAAVRESLVARMPPAVLPDRFAVGPDAAYLACPAGVLDSPLSIAFTKLAGDGVTTRNWNTVLRIEAALNPKSGS
jgi:uncharacterized protein (DUF1697 family)